MWNYNLGMANVKKRKASGLDKGLEELRTGKVHRYKSVKALVSDVLG
jgi:hypothetical protein